MSRILEKYNKEIIEVPDTMKVETWSYAEIEDLIEFCYESDCDAKIFKRIDLSEIAGKTYDELNEEQKKVLGLAEISEEPRKVGKYEVLVDFNAVGLSVVATLIITEEDNTLEFNSENKIYISDDGVLYGAPPFEGAVKNMNEVDDYIKEKVFKNLREDQDFVQIFSMFVEEDVEKVVLDELREQYETEEEDILVESDAELVWLSFNNIKINNVKKLVEDNYDIILANDYMKELGYDKIKSLTCSYIGDTANVKNIESTEELSDTEHKILVDLLESIFEELVTKISDSNYDITSCDNDDMLTAIDNSGIEIFVNEKNGEVIYIKKDS